jgi:methyltransferase
MLSSCIFWGFVSLVGLQRLAELRLSRRHQAQLERLGGTEHAPGQLRVMQLLHGLWLISMSLEVAVCRPPLLPWLTVTAALLFCAGQALRISAMRALGKRWTVGIYTLPGAPPVTTGIYRFLRHPNYLGVALEIVGLPLLHSAWRTALVFSVANAVLLAVRIRAEERALSAASVYRGAFSSRPRLWPGQRARGAS